MTRREAAIPPAIRAALEAGAALLVSISGGKDSQAMLRWLAALYRESPWPGEILALHADLGRAEWPETPGHVQRQADAYGVPLEVVRRPRGDLLDRFDERIESLDGTGTPFWPTPGRGRYCTADLKSTPLDKVLTRYRRVVSAIGIRAEESANRAKKPCWGEHPDKHGKRMGPKRSAPIRTALVWHPIFRWSGDEVWAELGTSRVDLVRRRGLYREGNGQAALDGWAAHPAYVYGNERLSCVFCIMGSKNDLTVGARHNPELARHYLRLEEESGFAFQQGRPLGSVIPVHELLGGSGWKQT